MNRQFRVNGIDGIETHIEILGEVEGGFETHITSISPSGVRESFEFISDELVASCLKTGFLVPEPSPVHAVLTA